LDQLERILESPHFRTTKRCSQFLRYVVEHASSDPAELKERTIGIEVFHRGSNYDTHQDPVVRVTAGEVRKRLAQYYLEPGHEAELRITLPPGCYVPELHAPPQAHEVVAPPEIAPVQTPEIVSEEPALTRRNRWWILGACLAALCIVAAALAVCRGPNGSRCVLESGARASRSRARLPGPTEYLPLCRMGQAIIRSRRTRRLAVRFAPTSRRIGGRVQ
jgi:hypothetical protein